MDKVTIDLDVVRSELEGVASAYTSCCNTMKTINTTYIDGTKDVWNTPSAATYIDKVCGAFNDFIKQFNENYESSFNDLVAGVNVLTASQDAETVSLPDLTPIASLSRSWEGQTTQFNIPTNYAQFTYDKLSARVSEFVELIGTIQRHVDTMVSNGLADSACTSIKASLESLRKSAEDVITQYDSDAAARAVNEDELVSSIKSNT